MEETAISLRIRLRADAQIGPGKAALLEGIRDTGSISAAGRLMGMSYKRAWYLLDTMNAHFREPVATASKGGKSGGGARLTATGHAVLDAYRRMEAVTAAAIADDLAQLVSLMTPPAD